MDRSPVDIGRVFIQNLTLILLIIGMLVISLFLRYFIRAYRGMLGIALGGLFVILLIYWLVEARKQIQSVFQERKGQFFASDEVDIVEHGDMITVAGRIPGPSDLINVGLYGRRLKISGGSNFRREFELKEECNIENYTYKNGVLEINLRKSDTI